MSNIKSYFINILVNLFNSFLSSVFYWEKNPHAQFLSNTLKHVYKNIIISVTCQIWIMYGDFKPKCNARQQIF